MSDFEEDSSNNKGKNINIEDIKDEGVWDSIASKQSLIENHTQTKFGFNEVDENITNKLNNNNKNCKNVDRYIINTNSQIEKEVIELATVVEESEIENVGNNLPFSELYKQKLFQELMNEANKRTSLLKSKIISQLNELFKMFDINHDGIIDEKDLKFTFTSLGETSVSEEMIKNMINESSIPIDFNVFVSLFESQETVFDSETDLIKAFSKWDHKSNGFLYEESLRNDLHSWGDRFSEKEIDYALEEAPFYDEDGKSIIDYIEFSANLCGLQNIRNSQFFQKTYLNNLKK